MARPQQRQTRGSTKEARKKKQAAVEGEGWRSVGRFYGRLQFAGTAPPFGGGQGGTHELVISESGSALEGTFTPNGGSAALVKFTRSSPPDCPPWLELS